MSTRCTNQKYNVEYVKQIFENANGATFARSTGHLSYERTSHGFVNHFRKCLCFIVLRPANKNMEEILETGKEKKILH